MFALYHRWTSRARIDHEKMEADMASAPIIVTDCRHVVVKSEQCVYTVQCEPCSRDRRHAQGFDIRLWKRKVVSPHKLSLHKRITIGVSTNNQGVLQVCA